MRTKNPNPRMATINTGLEVKRFILKEKSPNEPYYKVIDRLLTELEMLRELNQTK